MDVTLTLEQYDVLWADLELGEYVYPLAILGHGKTYAERNEVRRRAYQQLGTRGLTSGTRIHSTLQDLFRLIARAPVWLDMLWCPDPGREVVHNVVAARSGERGVVARLDPSGLRLRKIPGTSLIPELLQQLPASRPALGQPISLPRSALQPTAPAPGDTSRQDSPSRYGRFRAQVCAMEEVFQQPRLCGGQIAANFRDRVGRRHRSQPLDWFDTANGRWTLFIPAGAGDERHVTMTPADGARMAAQLREILNDRDDDDFMRDFRSGWR
ncbi:MAG: ESX secretion-associated protein EspG [Actinobacteria bacterium]|nr:ESX secretion-associated protein EspG [Actinomycetota bacterium]